jgi:sporulation protein YlmC with PRC-barrel domain
MSAFPFLLGPPKTLLREKAVANGRQLDRTDAHLRSTQAVNGYHVDASNGTAGHVCDFMMDDKSWAIGQLAVKTGHRFSGNEVLIPVSKVDRISYEKSTVFVNLTKEAVEQSSARDLAPVSATT